MFVVHRSQSIYFNKHRRRKKAERILDYLTIITWFRNQFMDNIRIHYNNARNVECCTLLHNKMLQFSQPLLIPNNRLYHLWRLQWYPSHELSLDHMATFTQGLDIDVKCFQQMYRIVQCDKWRNLRIASWQSQHFLSPFLSRYQNHCQVPWTGLLGAWTWRYACTFLPMQTSCLWKL